MACSPRSRRVTRPGLPDYGLQSITKLSRLVRRQLNNQAPAAFKRDPHDDATPLFGDLKRTVARPRLHRRHFPIPFLPAPCAAPLRGTAPAGTSHATIPGACGRTGQPQSSLSVALLSRVPKQNGNDRPGSLPPGARTGLSRAFSAGRLVMAPARRGDRLRWTAGTGSAGPPGPAPLDRRDRLRRGVAVIDSAEHGTGTGTGTGGSDVGGRYRAPDRATRAHRPIPATALARSALPGPG